jgi:hypothetical protein
MGVMAGAVKMLDVGGIGAGKPQLGRLKKPNFAVWCILLLYRMVSD